MKKLIIGLFAVAIMVAAITGCTSPLAVDTTAPSVISVVPVDTATGVGVKGAITATFSEAMDPATITDGIFTLAASGPVAGTVVLNDAGTVATFTPSADLAFNTSYTTTITVGAKDIAGNALASSYIWDFTTGSTAALGPSPVALGMAGNYVILAKTGVTNVPTSAITGAIGVSPIDSTAITGFTLIPDVSTQFSTSSQVTGRVYAADYAEPTPTNLGTAVNNMITAFNDAAGRMLPDFTELSAGDISGSTLVPGLYKWGTGVSINTDVTLSGDSNDVWIFQIAGDLTIAGAKSVLLSGGALPKNIFWQVAGGSGVTLGAAAHLEGIVLAQTAIILGAGASVNGRLLAQTAITLSGNTIVEPAL
jgi:hypothetical protein